MDRQTWVSGTYRSMPVALPEPRAWLAAETEVVFLFAQSIGAEVVTGRCRGEAEDVAAAQRRVRAMLGPGVDAAIVYEHFSIARLRTRRLLKDHAPLLRCVSERLVLTGEVRPEDWELLLLRCQFCPWHYTHKDPSWPPACLRRR